MSGKKNDILELSPKVQSLNFPSIEATNIKNGNQTCVNDKRYATTTQQHFLARRKSFFKTPEIRNSNKHLEVVRNSTTGNGDEYQKSVLSSHCSSSIKNADVISRRASLEVNYPSRRNSVAHSNGRRKSSVFGLDVFQEPMNENTKSNWRRKSSLISVDVFQELMNERAKVISRLVTGDINVGEKTGSKSFKVIKELDHVTKEHISSDSRINDGNKNDVITIPLPENEDNGSSEFVISDILSLKNKSNLSVDCGEAGNENSQQNLKTKETPSSEDDQNQTSIPVHGNANLHRTLADITHDVTVGVNYMNLWKNFIQDNCLPDENLLIRFTKEDRRGGRMRQFKRENKFLAGKCLPVNLNNRLSVPMAYPRLCPFEANQAPYTDSSTSNSLTFSNPTLRTRADLESLEINKRYNKKPERKWRSYSRDERKSYLRDEKKSYSRDGRKSFSHDESSALLISDDYGKSSVKRGVPFRTDKRAKERLKKSDMSFAKYLDQTRKERSMVKKLEVHNIVRSLSGMYR